MPANEFDTPTNSSPNTLYLVRIRDGNGSKEGGLKLSNSTISRFADHLLEANRHLLRFEVELADDETCSAVAEVLQARGCRVERNPFKYQLTLTVPEALPKSA